jgi:serine/threonine protein kinase
MRSKQNHRNALPQGFRLEEYAVESLLGHGGFGITYLAKDTRLEQWVAIKEYLPNELAVREGVSTVYAKSTSDEDAFKWGLQRFITEAQTLARFKHPNIVRVLRFFEAHGTAYMVMEYEDGDNLNDYLLDHPMNEDVLLAIVLPLLDGLEKIHAAGFLHRDIKPSNIFIRRDGSPVLLDFGAARYAVGLKTTSLTSIVSPGYAPFEQYDPKSAQGAWSDIYALGGVMYFLISGERPKEVVGRLKHDNMVRAQELGCGRYRPELLRAVDWALALDEQARPQSVPEWREALLAQPLETSPPPRTFYAQTVPKRGYFLGLILTLLLLIPCIYFCKQHFFAPLPELPRQQPLVPLDKENIHAFVESYLQASSRDDMSLLTSHYADNVVYYGWGMVGRDEISVDKQSFLKKWPQLSYVLQGEVRIEDTEHKNIKRVNFNIEFSASNPDNGNSSKGKALRVLVLRSRPVEGIRIIEEKEHVLEREKSTP